MLANNAGDIPELIGACCVLHNLRRLMVKSLRKTGCSMAKSQDKLSHFKPMKHAMYVGERVCGEH